MTLKNKKNINWKTKREKIGLVSLLTFSFHNKEAVSGFVELCASVSRLRTVLGSH